MTKDQDYPPNDGQPSDEELAAIKAEGRDGAEPGEEALRAELAALNDRVLRLAAELENTRRRADREKADANRYAIAGFARDLLSVADNFERALDAAPEEGETVDETVTSFVTGVRMTARALESVLERHGVKKISPKGEKFDPNLHQAVAQAPAPGVPQGFVSEVAQPGFVIGDRVLRAAMVIVSNGQGAPSGGAPEAGGGHVDTSV
ncbi:MAG: nucleotide exchange factor GrpE [Parvularculaceae bacterium]|nr:nucleotide exchange factor GrpE [Parvularculaceae bacterium]